MTAIAATWTNTLGETQALVAGATILAVALTALFGAGSGRRRARQERYATMVGTLAGWAELPFRVRRRMTDDPAAVAALVERAHHLQEQMVLDVAELTAECHWLAARYETAQNRIQHEAAPHLQEAWSTQPAGTSASMNLAGWGPTGLDKPVAAFRAELRYRFGWRRFINPVRLLLHRLRRKRQTSPKARPRTRRSKP